MNEDSLLPAQHPTFVDLCVHSQGRLVAALPAQIMFRDSLAPDLGQSHELTLTRLGHSLLLTDEIRVVAIVNTQQARYARHTLDARLRADDRLERYTPPAQGWLRAIREALGMSRADLAVRMGVTAASVNDIERSEADRRIKLTTLLRAADALDCDLVYALIPRQGLDRTVELAARKKLAPHVLAVTRTMELEDQALPPHIDFAEGEVQKLIDSGQVWS